jgi:hypothetical protein
MHLTLPWFLPVSLFVGWLCCKTARQLWKEKKMPGEVFFTVTLGLIPLVIWLFIQFFPQE